MGQVGMVSGAIRREGKRGGIEGGREGGLFISEMSRVSVDLFACYCCCMFNSNSSL